MYTWGCNDEGALGRVTSSDDGDEYMPGQVQLPLTPKIVQVSAGDSHSAVLLEDGSVYAWGTFRVCDGLSFSWYVWPHRQHTALTL